MLRFVLDISVIPGIFQIKWPCSVHLLVSTGMFELLLAELEPVDILASPEFDESRVSYSVVPPWTPAEPLAKCWVLQAPTSMPPLAGELLLLPKFARLVKLLYLKWQIFNTYLVPTVSFHWQ